MNHKRQQKRVRITGTAILTFKNTGEIQTIQTMTTDISLKGIGLYCDVPIETSTTVSITIHFMSIDGTRTDHIEGQVISNQTIEGVCFMGIQFNEDITPNDQPLLYDHIQKSLTWYN
jgi:c-di-GMP-binding flagellar brake protein YcgR